MVQLVRQLASTTLFSSLLVACSCSNPVTPLDDAAVPIDDGAIDASSEDASSGDASTEDASVLDASTDASVPDAPTGPVTCRDGAIDVVREATGGRVQGLGIAPLGDGWVIAYQTEDRRALQRLDGGGAGRGEPIALATGDSARGAVIMRPLGDGVLVHDGATLRFFAADGSEPHAALEGLGDFVFGEARGATVTAIDENDVIRVTLDDAGLAIERTPSGIDLSGFSEPTGGYLTARAMGVGPDGCLVLAGSSFSGEYDSTIRMVPVLAGAACTALDQPWPELGSIGSFGWNEATGEMLAVAGLYPSTGISRTHEPQLHALGSTGPRALGARFGLGLSYGPRTSIAVAPDRIVIAAAHASGYGENQVWLYSGDDEARELVDEDGASELTSAYVVWHPTLERVAALYGLDSTGYGFAERNLGMRCDL